MFAASLVDITRRAGQRNRGAVHYHFGFRDGLIVAVIDQHAAFLAQLLNERMALVTSFILRSVADRAPARVAADSLRRVKVLVTGSAGSIGRVVTLGLADGGHVVVGLDRVPQPDGEDGAWHTVDATDPDAVAAVFAEERVDAVVHLAGHPSEASLPDSLTSHVVTTGAVLDAMVEHDVRRLVYASSNHAVGRTPRAGLTTDPLDTGLLGTDVRPRPDTYYGVAKVATEALLSLYADRHGIDAVACRIGSFLERPETVRHLATWLSHDDCVRMVEAALTAPAPGFAVLYGISRNTRGWWDLEPGRALGYEPQDDAEDFADTVAPGPADQAEAAHVGGPYATAALERPALDRSS